LSISRNQFIQHFARLAVNEETSLFLGAGISTSAGYPSWVSLLQPCAKELNVKIDDSVNLYLLAQYYANRFSYSALKRIINENINTPKYESNLVDELLDLNFKSIWTTNYDTVLENNLLKRNISVNTIYNDRDLPNINKGDRVNIYKLNGDIKNLDNIVITQKDLDEYESKHEMLLTFFKRELVTNTFLFLGYSFKDTIVLSSLAAINRCLNDSTTRHYAILRRDKSVNFDYFTSDLEKRYNINVLTIDEYDELPEILRELNYEIKRKNIFFSGVFDRLPKEQNEFAYELCSKLTAAILKSNYSIYTGYGRNFGNYLAGNSLQFILCNNMNINKHLVMRPFLEIMSKEEKRNHRKMIINDCHVSIFMFGQTPTENGYKNSTGMMQEYEVAKELNRIIIPVGCTGYTATIIWEDIKNNLSLYPYLERYIDSLNEDNIDKTVGVIMKILEDVC